MTRVFLRDVGIANLKKGDILQSASGQGYVVAKVEGDKAVAVRTIVVTNPYEWLVMRKEAQGG